MELTGLFTTLKLLKLPLIHLLCKYDRGYDDSEELVQYSCLQPHRSTEQFFNWVLYDSDQILSKAVDVQENTSNSHLYSSVMTAKAD